MYECTFPFWAFITYAAICFALITGFIDVYIPISNIPTPESAEKRLANGHLEIFAKEKFNMRTISYVFIGSSIIAAILFLWYYFSLHPITSSVSSIFSCIGIIVATLFIMLLMVASLSFLFCIAGSIHMRIFTKKFSKLYDTTDVYITLRYAE